jgi:membrane protease YdiL (CAAX protease family)
MKEEISLLSKLKNIICCAVVYIIWSGFVLDIYGETIPEFMMVEFLQFAPQREPLSRELIFVLTCIFAPLIEELFFRAPLGVIRHIQIPGLMTFSIFFSSVLFAIGHILGSLSVPMQGVAGLLFCYVYIKNGYSYVSSVLMHFIINFYFFLS